MIFEKNFVTNDQIYARCFHRSTHSSLYSQFFSARHHHEVMNIWLLWSVQLRKIRHTQKNWKIYSNYHEIRYNKRQKFKIEHIDRAEWQRPIYHNQQKYDKKMQLNETSFVKQRTIVCQNTICFRNNDHANVIKFSWTFDKRSLEADNFRLTREKKMKNIVKFIKYQHIISINKLRNELIFLSSH